MIKTTGQGSRVDHHFFSGTFQTFHQTLLGSNLIQE